MLKKLLSLSLAAVMLSTAAFASPGGVMLMDATYAAESDEIVIETNAASITESGLTGTVSLNLTSTVGRDSAVLITAVYDADAKMLAASLSNEVTSVVAGDNNTTVTLPTVKTAANDKYVIKFFWWDSTDTLVPVVENAITVAPQPAVWSGTAEVVDEPALVDGYYQIENGEDLAWFSNKVDEDATVKAKLVNDIYLNNFIDNNGSFDEDWYEDADNVAAATSWTSTNNAAEASFCIASFAGEFDGNNKTIYGLYMQGGSGTGFFSSVAGGTVKNVTFKGAYVVSTTTTTISSGAYTNSANYEPIAMVTANVVTANTTSTFTNITAYGKITATEDADVLTAGGIIGRVDSVVNITDCTSYVDIIDSAKTLMIKTDGTTGTTVAVVKCGIGGIIGFMGDKSTTNDGANATLTRCYNYGNIIVPYANIRISGVVGHFRNGSLDLTSSCGNAGEIRAYKVGSSQLVGYRTSSYSSATAGATDTLTGGSIDTYDPAEVID